MSLSLMDQISSRLGQMGRSTKSIDYQDVPRPLAGLADEYPSGFVDPRHSHTRAQLLYQTAGVVNVLTDKSSFVLPPQRALWMPAGLEHEVYCRGHVSCRTLYISQEASDDLPKTCLIIEVSDLLRELIVEATKIPVEYDVEGRDGRVMALILDELKVAATVPFHVPMPHSERLARICKAILQDPAQSDALDDCASMAAMGRRTFTRTFRRETGMSFAVWRQNVRLMEALSRLAMGQPVTAVALDVGYSSPSAFTAMFRRTFGVPPTHYLLDPHQT